MEDFRLENVRLSEAAANYLKPDTPKNIKLLVARGVVPLPPRELVVLQYYYRKDSDPEVAQEAEKSLTGLPANILRTVLGSDIPPAILDFFARRIRGNRELLETLIINRATHDETIAELARTEKDEYILELIASNQERILRSPSIAGEIFRNSHASRLIKERLRGFLRTAFPIKGGQVIPEAEQVILAPSEVSPPVETITPEMRLKPAEPPSPAGPVVAVEGEWNDMIELTEELASIKLPDELVEEKPREISEEERKNLAVRISQMTVSEKIKLALLGNKEARSILVRDSNKLVSAAVVRSPKIQEDEIAKIAQMRNVADEVIRIIAQNKDWTKSYAVKKALVENPKTPVSISFRFLSMLRESDLKAIARSKNVPSAVAAQARRMVQQKLQ